MNYFLLPFRAINLKESQADMVTSIWQAISPRPIVITVSYPCADINNNQNWQ